VDGGGWLVEDGASVRPLDREEPRVIAEREVMLELQRAMLPAGLPVLAELSVAAEYAPADVAGSLGGDWFDVVPMPGDVVGLVVGDAVGHGAAAVAVMGQLRAVAAERLQRGNGLDEVMRALDSLAAGSPGARGCVVCIAVVDRCGGSVRYGVRGHPPPLVVASDGTTRFLTEATGPPLALARNAYRLAGTTLGRGETLVLYSDGAVERPRRTIGQGMADLAVCVSAAVRTATAGERGLAEVICSAVTGGLSGPGHRHDDVSVVAATRLAGSPPPMTMILPATPDQLGPMRRRFSAWLHGFQAGEDDVVALELSAVEAMTNSIEHAFPGPPGAVRIEATLDGDGRVCVVVSDDGRWKPPRVDPGFRGRGLIMMREFSDDLMLRTSAHGTTVSITKALHRPISLDGVTQTRPRRAEHTDVRIDVRVEPDRVVVSVAGAVDSSGIERLQASLRDAARRGSLPLTIVLTDVTLLASAGLRTLYEHAGNLLSAKRSVRLVAPDTSLARDVLAISGLDKLVDVIAELD
jgi:anti-anti-sigma factor